VQRGEIWWANLPDPHGSGPGYRRPVVIVQSDEFNRSRIHTVIVASITSNMRLARAPGNVVITRRESRLPRQSVINVSQLITLDRSYLTERMSRLQQKRVLALEDGLRLVLSL